MIWLLVILGIILVLGLLLVALYNRLVQQRNRVDNAWAQVEVQLKRRWDLIPNLVESVKGYAEHERGTFEAVTQARAAAQNAKTPAETASAEGILGVVLRTTPIREADLVVSLYTDSHGRISAVARGARRCGRSRAFA